MSISVSGLTKTYGAQKAVNGITFNIPSGKVVGFLGPNGAGKSTTMKMITGYLEPDSGEILVNGLSVRDHLREVQAGIGYLPEHNPLYPDMYVREFLEFAGKLSGIRKELGQRVRDVVEKTGLLPEAHKRIQQLSKGYRQRVGLAQALLHDPPVLILDEPTSGLDPNQVSGIRALIREISPRKTILFSTHIMQEVEVMCDHVIIINQGEIVSDKPLADLQEQTESWLRVKFKSAMDIELLRAIPGVWEVEPSGEEQFRLRLAPDCPIEERLFELAVDQNNIMLEQHRERKSLDDLFQVLTNPGKHD